MGEGVACDQGLSMNLRTRADGAARQDAEKYPRSQTSACDVRAARVTATLPSLLDTAWRAVHDMDGMEIAAAMCALRHLLWHTEISLLPCLRQEVETLLAIGSVWDDDAEQVMRHAQAALNHGRAGRYRSMLVAALKYAYWRKRDFAAFYAMSRTKAMHAHPGSLLPHVVCLSIEAAVEAEQLRFKLAERLAKDAIWLAGQAIDAGENASLLPTCILAQLLYEAGALEEADAVLRGRLPALAACGSIESALLGFVVSAKIAWAKGHFNLALLLLRRGEAVGEERQWLRLIVQCQAETIALLIGQRHLEAAEYELARLRRRLAQSDALPCLDDVDRWPMEVARLRLQMAKGTEQGTVRALDGLRDAAIHHHHPAWVVKLTILLSSALFECGDAARAHQELVAALRQGVNAGLFRTFVDQMPMIEPLLKQLWRSPDHRPLGYLGAYVGSLVAANSGVPARAKKGGKSLRAPEALSARETIILRLISQGLSNKRIARELRITPETVKSHAKNIFIKLGTKTRAEAVSRATELGLL